MFPKIYITKEKNILLEWIICFILLSHNRHQSHHQVGLAWRVVLVFQTKNF